MSDRWAHRFLVLRRRRSRLPWIYTVYHARERALPPSTADDAGVRTEGGRVAGRAAGRILFGDRPKSYDSF